MDMKKNLVICSIVLFLIGALYVREYTINREWYYFKRCIRKEFNYIYKATLSHYGPHCTIDVYLEDYDFEKVELAFISILKRINNVEYFDYLLEHHNKHSSAELTFLHISFREKGNDDEVLYKFSSYKEFEEWKLEDNLTAEHSGKVYSVSDYLK